MNALEHGFLPVCVRPLRRLLLWWEGIVWSRPWLSRKRTEAALRRGGSGPRQPGGGRQIAGPRHHGRGRRHVSIRHPEVLAQRASKGGGPHAGRASFEGRLRRPPQDDEVKPSTATPTTVQTVAVTPDESGMSIDRFLEARFPGLSFSHIQRIIRKGELRVNGKRAKPKDRLSAGQSVRIPPLKLDAPAPRAMGDEAAAKTRDYLRSITLYEDADVMVLNKPMGLVVQGGSGTTRHLDGMLEALRDAQGQRPRLVHRLDKDTAGCLLVAK